MSLRASCMVCRSSDHLWGRVCLPCRSRYRVAVGNRTSQVCGVCGARLRVEAPDAVRPMCGLCAAEQLEASTHE